MSWTFHTLPYARPDFDAGRAAIEEILAKFIAADSYEAARDAYFAIQAVKLPLFTAVVVAHVRNTIDTTDAFYEAENEYCNQERAKLTPLFKRIGEALVATPFRKDFEAEFGNELFLQTELELKTMADEIVEDLIRESALSDEYSKLVATCRTDFRGESVNFYGLLREMENPDRTIRRAAFDKWAEMYEGVSEKLDSLFDQLIEVRLTMAEKLGFPRFTELAYAGMGRSAYDAEDVVKFREQVKAVIVPAVAKMRAEQGQRIGVDKLRFYDEAYFYPDGNADPKGDEATLKAAARVMYQELSPETGEFFDFMLEHDLFDLKTRPGKRLGGYCTQLGELKATFIFSNFNGTAADIGVLTHEAGHAFAGYSAMRAQPILDYAHATAEIAEIHSMTMEHFAYPWFGNFYGEANAEKARYAHLCDALGSVPYLCAVDAFQYELYKNPRMGAKARRELWRGIEKEYMPWRDYDGVEFLENGGFWMQKQHIFLYPFYYIDYALAQVCAFAFYGRMKKDRSDAWNSYLKLCRAGGSKGFVDLLKLAKLPNPFEQGAVKAAVSHVIEELSL